MLVLVVSLPSLIRLIMCYRLCGYLFFKVVLSYLCCVIDKDVSVYNLYFSESYQRNSFTLNELR